MGLTSAWINDFIGFLNSKDILFELYDGVVPSVKVQEKMIIRFINLDNEVLQETFEIEKRTLTDQNFLVYNLWEDVWFERKAQVSSRILYFTGHSKRIHARKCVVQVISKHEIKHFLEDNHLQGSARIKYGLGLFYENRLVAVAGFNKILMPSKGEMYISSELVRFCSLPGLNIAGGLSKLIKWHHKEHLFNDLMTYADRDWSAGNGYASLGFDKVGTTPPLNFYVNGVTMKRLTEKEYLTIKLTDHNLKYYKVFNSGNIKYILNGNN